MSKAKEYEDTNEAKIIILLSGYIRELGEGKDYEKTTYALAETFEKLITNKTLEDVKAKENDLLNLFCLFLEDDGYLDTDWRAEEPYAIDEFKKSKQYQNWKTELEKLKL